MAMEPLLKHRGIQAIRRLKDSAMLQLWTQSFNTVRVRLERESHTVLSNDCRGFLKTAACYQINCFFPLSEMNDVTNIRLFTNREDRGCDKQKPFSSFPDLRSTGSFA